MLTMNETEDRDSRGGAENAEGEVAPTPREGTRPTSGLVVAYSDPNWTPIRFDIGHCSDLKRTVVRADIGQFSGGIGLVSESWRKTKFVS